MSFSDKLKFNRWQKIASVLTIGGALIFGGNAISTAAPTSNGGIAAFSEAYLGQEKNTRTVEQDLSLISNNFHLDMDSKAVVTADGTITMRGELSWSYTNLKKNYSKNNFIPFYIEQSGDEMTLYVKRYGAWKKMLLPGLPAGIASLWSASDISSLRETMNAVKSVDVLEDTPDMRVMNVTLDGNKIAALLEKNSQKSFANLTGDELAEHKEILNRWLVAIRANDITFAWTVNKPDWTTVTAAFDLTPIMRAYSRFVLDEMAAGRVTLTDEERDLLDAMGYYAELRSYTTNIPKTADTIIYMPENVKDSPEDDDALDDIFAEMTTVVEK